jgi:hypothetical protein
MLYGKINTQDAAIRSGGKKSIIKNIVQGLKILIEQGFLMD